MNINVSNLMPSFREEDLRNLFTKFGQVASCSIITDIFTGASKGLGLALVKKLLLQGHRVAATSRSADDLQKSVGAASEAFLPLSMQCCGIAAQFVL